MRSTRILSLASMTALGLSLIAPDAHSLAGDRRERGQSAPASAPQSSGGGGRRESAPAPAPRVERSAPQAPRSQPAPRSEPAPRREAPPVRETPRYEPPQRRSEPAPRYEPPVQPVPERRERRIEPSTPPPSSGSPSDGRDSGRRDDSARTPYSRREAPVAPPTPSAPGGGDDGPKRFDDPAEPRDNRVPPGGTSGGRRERVYDSLGPIDLGPAARPPVVRFPAPTASPNRAPAALGSRRLAELENERAKSGSGRRIDFEAGAKPIALDTPIGGGGHDRRALLDRYKDRSALAQPDGGKRADVLADVGRSGAKEPVLDGTRRKEALDAAGSPGASRLDGSRRKEALSHEGDARVLDGAKRKEALANAGETRVLDGARRKEALANESAPRVLDGSKRKEALGDASKDDHSRRIEAAERTRAQRAKLGRLERLARERREEYTRVHRTGAGIAATTSTAVTIGLGYGIGACTGTVPGWFWDPYSRGGYECSPYTNWGLTWWWGWSSWAWPCSSWAFGYRSSHWNVWWSSYACSPWSYRWCPYPAYYSAVVYDTYDPEPVVIYRDRIVYEDAPAVAVPVAAPAPGPAPAIGEGVIRDTVVPVPARQDDDRSGEETRVWVDKGDAAWREGRYADAVYAYARAVDSAPNEGVYHLILSDALFATGEYHYGSFSLRRALELDPDLLQSTLDKRNLYPNPKDFDEQLAVLERYVADHPIDEGARLLLAANYLFSKQPAQCADALSSPYAVALRENAIGKMVLDRANELRQR